MTQYIRFLQWQNLLAIPWRKIQEVLPEIVLYDMLMQLVERMGITNAISVLSQSLSEEKAMADWIRTNAPDVLMQLWPEIEASIAKREEAQSVETK
jgi:hypothetical protein